MRISGVLAAFAALALAACASGGSPGVTPAGSQTNVASTARATDVSTAGRGASDQGGDCDSGRHDKSAARSAQGHDGNEHYEDGDHKSACCPSSTGTGSGSGGTGTRDRDRRSDDDGGDKNHTSCCPATTTTGGGSGGTATRDHDRRGNDDGGDKDRNATPSPSPTPCATAAGRLTIVPTSVTIDCAIAPTATFSIAGTHPGLAAKIGDPSVATIGTPAPAAGGSLFTITGLGGPSTSIVLTDTLGDTGTVAVTVNNCPAPTPPPIPTRLPGI